MTRRILVRPEAEQELIEAITWYEQRGRGLGAEFLRAFEAAISLIERYPRQNPVVTGQARRAVLRRFPYSLIYVESESEILILACFHGRRDPRRLQGRLAK
jgi:plasmid stabilization system protein ParE